MPIVAGSDIEPEDFINESEQNGTRSNDEGRVPKLEDDGYIANSFTKNSFRAACHDPLNGATTPVPVLMGPGGDVFTADADGTGLADFIGFVKANNSTVNVPTYLGVSSQSGFPPSGTFSHTLQAGTNRVIIVFILHAEVGTPTTATSVTFNGNALTKVTDLYASRAGISVWRRVEGTSASPTTANIVVTGGTLIASIVALNYGYIDQTTPIASFDIDSTTSVGTFNNSVTPTKGYSTVVQGITSRTGNASAIQPTNSRFTSGNSLKVGDDIIRGATATNITATSPSATSGTEVCIAASIVLSPSESNSVEVFAGKVISGFTGLTKGARYYLSNTIGTISTTPGGTSRLVGKAVSATELLIIQN